VSHKPVESSAIFLCLFLLPFAQAYRDEIEDWPFYNVFWFTNPLLQTHYLLFRIQHINHVFRWRFFLFVLLSCFSVSLCNHYWNIGTQEPRKGRAKIRYFQVLFVVNSDFLSLSKQRHICSYLWQQVHPHFLALLFLFQFLLPFGFFNLFSIKSCLFYFLSFFFDFLVVVYFAGLFKLLCSLFLFYL